MATSPTVTTKMFPVLYSCYGLIPSKICTLHVDLIKLPS